MRFNKAVVTVLTLLLLTPSAAELHAQQGDLAIGYELVPRPGAAVAFERAIAEHAQWRRDNGDPWNWDVYEVVVGDNLGTFIARAGGLSWADFDTYDEFAPRAGGHFTRTVGPHLQSNSSRITRFRPDESRLPEDGQPPQLFWVTTYRVKPGKMREFWELVGKFHQAIVQADVPVHYVFDMVVAGSDGPEVFLVTLHENWASFEEPDPNVGQALREAYGEDEASALGERFSATIDGAENIVVRHRPDLSVRR